MKDKKDKIIEKLKYPTLVVLNNHIGELNAIGMAELYEAVTGNPWENRISDTRPIRYVVTALRREGLPICSSAARNGGGYYIAAVGSELHEYLKRQKIRALKILSRNARIQKITLPNYLGQLRLEMESSDNGETSR